MSVTTKKNEVFEFYQYLPQDVRAVVIDEMQLDDRCRFTRCSKSSQKEAKTSRKFMYGLAIACGFDDGTIEVLYGTNGPTERQTLGYILEFSKEEEEILLRCLNLQNKDEFWRRKFSGNVDLGHLAFRHFKNILHDYQDVIKQLEVSTIVMEDLGVRRFMRLEEVTAKHELLASQIFPKLQRPLKYIRSIQIGNSSLASCEEVYQVENEIYSWILGFTNEQFLRLKASKLSIHIGELSVENVYNFINLWKNGKVRKNFESCTWELVRSDFDIHQLFSLFGVEFGSDNRSEVEIKNNEDPTKIALLVGYKFFREIQFTVKGK